MSSVEILSMLAFLAVFLATLGTGLLVFWKSYEDERRARSRLRELSDGYANQRRTIADFALDAIPKLGTLLLADNEDDPSGVRGRLLRAGYRGTNAVRIFLGVKLALMLGLPVLLALVPYLCGALTLLWAMVCSCAACALGMLAPNLWLERRIARRQRELRRGLPDTLDMLVLCLEGGLSLLAALHRITEEVQHVHPTLGQELYLVEQTMQLGLSAGDALKKFGERCDLPELRELASVVLQSERYGASVAKALRGHADHAREERQQRAEEQAQKAAVKILFPMLLFIFPAIFVVLLGPAAFQIAKVFSQ